MGLINLIRLIVLGVVAGFALICFGIGCNFVANLSGTDATVGGFALAIALITLLLIPAVVVIGHIRKGAIFSIVWFELVWVGILSILWLAVAGHATAQLFGQTLQCDSRFFTDEFASFCRQYQAIQAFSWLNWLVLMAWFWFLLITSLINMRHNSRVWFGAPSDIANKGAAPPAQAYPPQNYGTPQPGYAGTPQPGYGTPAPAPYQQPLMSGTTTYPPANAPYQSPQHTGGYAPPTGAPYAPPQAPIHV